jgi:ADP-ribose pyrophosphatase
MPDNTDHHPAVQILEKTRAFDGYFKIDRYSLRHRTFAGGWSAVMDREVFERGHVAAALLYDPDRDTVVLVEQFRVGALAAGREPWQTEIVAGIIEAGESAVDVARREVDEEAGLEVLDLMPMHDYLVSPGGATETVAMYCARVDSRGAGGVHGLDDEHEDIRSRVMPYDDAMAMLREGKIGNALGIIALQWLALNRERVRTMWR